MHDTLDDDHVLVLGGSGVVFTLHVADKIVRAHGDEELRDADRPAHRHAGPVPRRACRVLRRRGPAAETSGELWASAAAGKKLRTNAAMIDRRGKAHLFEAND
jgi:hypothetical protein